MIFLEVYTFVRFLILLFSPMDVGTLYKVNIFFFFQKTRVKTEYPDGYL